MVTTRAWWASSWMESYSIRETKGRFPISDFEALYLDGQDVWRETAAGVCSLEVKEHICKRVAPEMSWKVVNSIRRNTAIADG